MNKLIGLKRQARKAGWKKDWTPADEEALLKGCWFDEAAGNDPVDFIESFCVLCQGEHAGQRIELLPWMKEDFIIPLYGWMRPGGTRRFRRTYLTVAKKNAKSTLCSCLSIYGLVGDGEPGAEVYNAATTRQQASIVFNDAANMVEASPELSNRLQVKRHTSTILCGNNAWIRALAAEGDSVEGLKIYYLIRDELHVWRDPKFYNSLRWGMASRRQPLQIDITTAGDDPNGIWGETHSLAEKVLSGEVLMFDFLPVIFAPDDKADIDSEETLKAGNPSLGAIFSLEDLKNDLAEAKQRGASDIAAFKRYRLNMAGFSVESYFPLERFKLCKSEYTDEDLAEFPCFAGVDISSKEDLCSLVLCFFTPNGIDFRSRTWVPEEKVKQETKAGRNEYQRWVDKGFLIEIPGVVINQDFVLEQIISDFEQFRIQGIAFDRWNSDQLMRVVQEKGVEVVEWGQNFKDMNQPTKELKNYMLAGKAYQDGNEVFLWQVGNTVVDEDNQKNIRPVKKKKNQRFKIDAAVAGIMAFGFGLRSLGDSVSRFEEEDNSEIMVV